MVGQCDVTEGEIPQDQQRERRGSEWQDALSHRVETHIASREPSGLRVLSWSQKQSLATDIKRNKHVLTTTVTKICPQPKWARKQIFPTPNKPQAGIPPGQTGAS